MINEKLFAELEAMGENVMKLEVETERAVQNMKDEIEKNRDEKAAVIAEFLQTIQNKIIAMNIERIDILAPIYFGNGGYPLRILFVKGFNVDITEGLYYGILEVRKGKFVIDCDNDSYAKTIARKDYELIVDKWNDEVQFTIEERIIKEIKKELASRSEKAAAKLKETNDMYDNYFKN